jgi:hypothetical protein
MPYVEYSDTDRDAEKIWSKSPRRFVLSENRRRRELGEPELRCRGLTDKECSPRQLAWNREADLKERIRLARAEALLLDVRSEIARSTR